MIPLYRKISVQIDITNACKLNCAHCNRLVGHHKKSYFMDVDTVAKSIESLDGFPGTIGIIGGDPTIHPDFIEICKLMKKMVPRKKRQIATAGYKWEEYKEIIYQTFEKDHVQYNNHSENKEVFHQPLLLAGEDILEDRELMWRLIGNCWMQWRWCSSITPKGGYMCEPAGAMDILFDGETGYPIEKGWWNKETEQFVDQVKRFCPKCSIPIPLPKYDCNKEVCLISKSNAERLKKVESPRFMKGKTVTINIKYTESDIQKFVDQGWAPWHFRNFAQHNPEEKKMYKEWEGMSNFTVELQ
ncbi:MAG: radical SAM protein [Bacteroidetes bacterium]|nr:radical SAM protein [Bacteroidota bacterium]